MAGTEILWREPDHVGISSVSPPSLTLFSMLWHTHIIFQRFGILTHTQDTSIHEGVWTLLTHLIYDPHKASQKNNININIVTSPWQLGLFLLCR